MPVPKFLQMDQVEAHQDLLEKGWVISQDTVPDVTLMFISHQWLGYKHPDRHFQQLSVLQSAIKNAVAGKITIEMDFVKVKAVLAAFLHPSRREARGDPPL